MLKRALDEVVQLAWHKKKISERLAYLTKGLIFLPFLLFDRRVAHGGENSAISQSSSGDDVYPLF